MIGAAVMLQCVVIELIIKTQEWARVTHVDAKENDELYFISL